ncbi:MAG: hypothetical protein HFG46_13655 [Clostridium sp.]|nr:hypothetical protein [Clostridium sp.]
MRLLEWNREITPGLSVYQKPVSGSAQAVCGCPLCPDCPLVLCICRDLGGFGPSGVRGRGARAGTGAGALLFLGWGWILSPYRYSNNDCYTT